MSCSIRPGKGRARRHTQRSVATSGGGLDSIAWPVSGGVFAQLPLARRWRSRQRYPLASHPRELDRSRERAVAALDKVIVLVFSSRSFFFSPRMVRRLSVTLSSTSFFSSPGSSAVISIALSVSLISMLGMAPWSDPGCCVRHAVEQAVDFVLQERERVGIAAGHGTLGSNRDHGFVFMCTS